MKKAPAFKDFKLIQNYCVGICVSRWNHDITDKLCKSAVKTLINNGLSRKNITILHVPGSFELPTASHWLAEQKNIHGVISIGCIIKGETKHDEYLAQAVANGLVSVSIKTGKPVSFGVLTTNNYKEAEDRSGGKKGNKGEEAAYAVLEMMGIYKKFTKYDFRITI